MRHKVILILIAVALIFVLGIQLGVSAEEGTTKITSKLDEVLANQAEILKQFDEIKQELAVLKMRCTR